MTYYKSDSAHFLLLFAFLQIRYGKIIKGQDRQIIRSKYEEDVYLNNHISVWGSYWSNGKWGYQCCHSFIKNSYCTGESGKKAAQVSSNNTQDKTLLSETEEIDNTPGMVNNEPSSSSESSSDDEDLRSKTERQSKASKRKLKKQRRRENRKNKKRSTGKEEEDTLKEALRKEEKNTREAEKLLKMDERQRPYYSMHEAKEPTTEEIEAYQMKRKRDEDPMAHFL